MTAPAGLTRLLLALLGAAALPAQATVPLARAQAEAAVGICEWVGAFERGRLGPRGTLRRGGGLQPAYVKNARRAGLVSPGDPERITHLDLLGKMLDFAENHPSNELTEAVLDVASAGFERAFLDQQALEVREVGHWSLMRTEYAGAWFLLLRAAAGEHTMLLSAHRQLADDVGGEGLTVGPARRVAALRLLGMRNRPVFRSTIEACLYDPDPRVRLAAVEALDFQRRPRSLPKVVEVIQNERHPVVAQALTRLMRVLVSLPGDAPSAAERRRAVRVSLAQFGLSGWRNDMDLLQLVERYPSKSMIPALIKALERASEPPDELVATVNARASLLLRERAGSLLKAMTGALIAADDPDAWREFWEREQDRIVVPAVLKKARSGGTRAAFFGVPVSGASIAFLIDTSGSMEQAVAGTSAGGSRSRDNSRLGAAKQQIVLAVQAMDPNSRYQLLTFAAEARTWTRKPIRPASNSTRSLTELLSRLHANGGTNLFDGLVKALQLDELGYGESHKTRIDELFVLSDGEPTAGAVQDADAMLKLVREANKYAKVRIHCVFTGVGEGASLLQRLAAENDGVFVQR